MRFRLTASRANGFVWHILRSTNTTIVGSRFVHRHNFRALPSCSSVNNYATKLTNQPCRALSTKLTEETVPIAFYEEIIDLKNHPEKLLIDVREPIELQNNGEIPNCINIPLGDLTNALNLSDERFEQKYGPKKPTKSTPIIFYCQIGYRSAKATVAAANLGFTNVKNYEGSWMDYARKEGLLLLG